jgi:restriction endonuclease S subunit
MTLVSTLGHYLDTHWTDYERVLTPNPVKRQQIEQLHATLEGLMKEIAPLNKTLKAQERP